MGIITASRFLFLALLNLAKSNASPWIGTQYVEVVVTSDYYRDETVTTFIPVSPIVSNPPVLSTFTAYGDDYYGPEVTAINRVIAPSAGIPLDDLSSPDLQYWVILTLTPPSSCSFTNTPTPTTKTCSVDVPRDAQGFVTPTATAISSGSWYTTTGMLLEPSAIPKLALDSASKDCMPYRWTICDGDSSVSSTGTHGTSKFCYDYTDTLLVSDSAIGGGTCCDDVCKRTWGISLTQLILIICFSWTGLWLIASIWETWVIFRRAMVGKKSRRGVPTCFIFIWTLLFCLMVRTRKPVYEKTPEQQEWLTERWKAMSAGAKIGMWLRNLFKTTDPSAKLLQENGMMHDPSLGPPVYYSSPGGAPLDGPGASGAPSGSPPAPPSMPVDPIPGQTQISEKEAHVTVSPSMDDVSQTESTVEHKDEPRVTTTSVRES